MSDVLAMVDRLIDAGEARWARAGNAITVELGESGRRQRVTIQVRGQSVFFRSVVLSESEVTQSVRRWRELARQVWRRNATKELVCFTFDGSDRLIGQVVQPVATLDPEELVVYVDAVARECDEYEYRLSGEDEF